MDELQKFIQDYLGLAKFRGLGEDNPVKFELEDAGNIFDVIVAYTEPTFSKTKYNVLWLPADPNATDYGKLLRRSDHAQADSYSGTWEEVTVYNDRFSQIQYWEPVVENPVEVGIDPIEVTVDKATVADLGIILLTSAVSGSRAVEDNDPRMTDDRVPTDHDHPDYPRSLVKINDTDHAIVSGSVEPVTGSLLFIKADNEDGTYDAEWRLPAESDVIWSSPELLSLDLSLPPEVTEISDNSSVYIKAAAHWSNGFIEDNPDDVTWSVESNVLGIMISSEGELSVPDLTTDYVITVFGNKLDPITEETVRGTLVVQIRNWFTDLPDLTDLVIEGDVSMWEDESRNYIVRAYFDDGSNAIVVPNSFIKSAGDAGTLVGQTLNGTEVTEDETVTLEATYMHNGTELTDTHDVLIRDRALSSIAINGATSMDEGDVEDFTVTAYYTDGTNRLVEFVELDTFISDRVELTLTGYQGTAGDVITDTVVTITAQLTEKGVIQTDTHLVTIINVNKEIVSIEILGAASMLEGDTEAYTVEATFDDGSKNIVIPDSFTLDTTTYATLNGQDLTGESVDTDQVVTLNAEYTHRGTPVSDTHDVTIQNVVLDYIELTGSPASVNERQDALLAVTAFYTNGASRAIAFAELDSLIDDDENNVVEYTDYTVHTESVESNTTVIFTAEYTEESITRTDTFTLTIVDLGVDLVSVAIIGDSSFYESEGRDYSLEATYSDGSTQPIAGDNPDITWTLTGTAGILTDNRVDGTDVNEDTVVTLDAEYIEDGTSYPATLDITIIDVLPASMVLTGPSTMAENTTRTLSATVTYTDGSTASVDCDPLISDDPGLMTIVGMDVTAGEVAGDIPVVFTGDYTEGSTTVQDTHTLTVTDETVYLDYITILGATSINEGDTQSYQVRAYYTDGSNTLVPFANLDIWTTTAPGSLVDGELTAGSVGSDTIITLSAQFTDGGVIKSDTHDVTIINVVPQSLVINGPASVEENSSADYTFTVNYSDGSSQNVTHDQLDSFVTDSPGISSISDNTLNTGEVANDTSIILSAQYTEDGEVVADNHSVNITDKVAVQSIEIVGADSLVEQASADYTFTVTYTDLSTEQVSAGELDSFTTSNTTASSISDATLTANSVTTDTTVTLTAQFTFDNKTVSDTHDVLITDNAIETLTIVGPATLSEGLFTDIAFTVTYKDGSTKPVLHTELDSFVSNKAELIVSGTRVTAGTVTEDTMCRLTAQYTEESKTISDTHDINVLDTDKVPVGINSIIGPSIVNELETGNYSIWVIYDDGSQSQEPADSWSLVFGQTHGSITNGGVFTANEVTEDEAVSIQAEYQGFDLSRTITVRNVPVTATGLTISGATSGEEGTTVSLTATAALSNSSNLNVTSSATWSFVGNSYGSSVSASGVVTLGDVDGDQSITVSASYVHPEGGTVSDTHIINIQDVAVSSRLFKWVMLPSPPASASAVTAAWIKANVTDDLTLATPDTAVEAGFAFTSDGVDIPIVVVPADDGFFYFDSAENPYDDQATWPGYFGWSDGAHRPIVVDIDGVEHHVFMPDFPQSGVYTITMRVSPSGSYPNPKT